MPQQGYDEALQYASKGWRVMPIRKGTKQPAINAWQKEASTDPEVLKGWWADGSVQGVGIATGPESGLFVLDVDIGDEKRGDDTLADLERNNQQLPETLEVVTGSGGRHLYFKWPEGQDVRNSAGKLGPGLDIRGSGGQVVAPGSLHPTTGRPYEWEGGVNPDHVVVADAPQWLLDILKPNPEITRENQASDDQRRDTGIAMHVYNASTTDQGSLELMVRQGWVHEYTDRDGTIYIRRPGREKGQSGTIGRVAPGVFYSFTGSIEGYEAERAYDPIYLLAMAYFNGDMAAADQHLHEQGWGARSIGIDHLIEEWLAEIRSAHVDEVLKERYEVSEAWDLNFQPPMPSLMKRSDGIGMLYPGKIHVLVGEPETGKSWISLLACIDAVTVQGKKFLFVDFEGEIGDFMYRAKLLGMTREQAQGSYYIAPKSLDEMAIDSIVDLIEEQQFSVVVIDSVNRAMGKMGLNYEKGPEYVKFTDVLVEPLARASSRPSVIMIDHVVKSREARGRYSTGSEQKLGQIDVSYHLEPLRPFGAGLEGMVGVRIAKDRPGGLRAKSYGTGETRRFALIIFGENEDGTKDMSIDPWIDPVRAEGEDKALRKTFPWKEMEAISDLLVDMGPMPEVDLKFWLDFGKPTQDWALKMLMDREYIGTSTEDTGRTVTVSHRPYRGIHDPKSPVFDEDADRPDR